MTDKKLTPRVGDRVLLVVHIDGKGLQTRIGTVVEDVAAKWRGEPYFRIQVDGITDDYWQMSQGSLTVVDREPVKWPEGWEPGDHYEWGPDSVAIHRNANLGFSKQNLIDILATGPDMLARWDELMGGDE